MVQLQRTVGNRAIQRLMSISDMSMRIPAKSINKGGKLFGTKSYKEDSSFNSARENLLKAAGSLHSYVKDKVSHKTSALQMQLSTVSGLYDGVITGADRIIAMVSDPSDERYGGALEVKVQATNEKTTAIEKFMARIRNPPTTVSSITVKDFIGVDSQPIYMNSVLISGTVGGGMNQLTKYGSQTHGNEYFKPNMESLDSYDSLKEALSVDQKVFGGTINQMMENSNRLIDTPDDVRGLSNTEIEGIDFGEHGDKEGFAKNFETHGKKNINTEFLEHGGIDLKDLRSSQREVAMARLGTLLGTDIISKANLAIKKSGMDNVPKLGSVAPEAKGKDISQYNLVDDSSEHPGTPNTISRDDPVLLSKVSGLYLIDFLAGQIDRHQGNYMIQVDGTGKVIGVTGIDNDMSFGTKEATKLSEKGARQLPMLSKYFDIDMASRIMALDPDLVRLAMSDLLRQDEINALIDRLKLLKVKLEEAQSNNQLLTPDQWSNLINSAPQDFQKSDYAKSIVTSK